MTDQERWDRDDTNKARDTKLMALTARAGHKVAIHCRQCAYDRVSIRSVRGMLKATRTCAWCGATGRQRVDEVRS